MQDWQSQLAGIQAGDIDPAERDKIADKIGDEMQLKVRRDAKDRAAQMTDAERSEFLEDLTEDEQDLLRAYPHAVVAGWDSPELYHLRLAKRFYHLYQAEKTVTDRSRWLLLMSACYLQLAGRYASDYDRYERAAEINTVLGPIWSSRIADIEDENDIFPMIQETNESVSVFAELDDMGGFDR